MPKAERNQKKAVLKSLESLLQKKQCVYFSFSAFLPPLSKQNEEKEL